MKRIFKYIAIVLAAVSAMPVMASAQGTVELSKKVKDNEDGTYTLTLESFVTGETVQKIVTHSCDIVLVLDNTSSMYKTNMDGSGRTNADAKNSRIEALINAIASEGGFIDQIYQSAKDGNVSHNISIVEFKGGIPRSGDYQPSTSNGAWWTNHDLVFWDSDLTYEYDTGTGKNKVHHIVPVTTTMSEWGANGAGLSDWMTISGESTVAKEAIKTAINKKGGIFDYCPRSESGANGQDGGTPSGSALVRAGQLLNADGIKDDGNPKIVVFFTDGQCGYDASWNQYNRAMACEVIKQANLLKGENVTIYSIGTFGSSSSNDTNGYLNHVSSKFNTEVTIEGQNLKYNAADVNPTAAADNQNVFLASDSAALSAAFAKIAQDVQAASQAYDLDEESAVVLDVLTNMFKLRYPTDESKIRLYTCDVVTTNKRENVQWVSTGTVSEGGNIIVNKDADNNIIADSAAGDHKEYWVRIPNTEAAAMIEINGANNDEIYVTGFDYATNYVGAVKNNIGQITGWHDPGKKLIIQFDIVTDPANTGGLNLNTNEPESGIYKIVDGTLVPVEVFEEPTVQLPYLEIVKYGLADGESATFTVEKVDASGNVVTDATKYFAKVIITNKGGETAPSAVLKLLYTGHYRVTEGAWAWTYTPGTEGTVQTKQLVTVKSGDKIPNNVKFEFTDTKKTSSSTGYIEGAEDYVVNNLNTGAKTKISTGANE